MTSYDFLPVFYDNTTSTICCLNTVKGVGLGGVDGNSAGHADGVGHVFDGIIFSHGFGHAGIEVCQTVESVAVSGETFYRYGHHLGHLQTILNGP